MGDDGSVDCEEGTVDKGVAGRQTKEHSLNEAQSKMEGGHTKLENRSCRRPHRIGSCY